MVKMEKVEFLKLHGLGNDFVLIDETGSEVVEEDRKSSFCSQKCNRNRGIGADGVLFLRREDHGVQFRIFNADGSEAETCVNGLRCAALALHLRLWEGQEKSFNILTAGGTVRAKIVDMVNDLEAIVELEMDDMPLYQGFRKVEAAGTALIYHLIDVGNPHAVTFIDGDLGSIDVEGIGHAMEYHDQFSPQGINTEFVRMDEPGKLNMRVHERGACETQACGSGAMAAARAANELNPDYDQWTVEMPGGKLDIILGDRTSVRGPAALAFEGRTYF